jgi:hypothetical protein
VILLLVFYLKEHKTGYNRDTCALMFITAPFTIAKLWKQPSMPYNCRMDQEIVVYIYIYTME